MKKTILLALAFLSFQGYSQEFATTDTGKRVVLEKNGTYKFVKDSKLEATELKDSDFKMIEGDAKVLKRDIYVLAGNEKRILCSFSFSAPILAFKNVGINTINSMLSTGYIKPMFKVKNKSTFVPNKINLFYIEKSSEWLLSIDYTAQNDYGATKDGRFFVTYDEKGEFKSIMSGS